MQRQLSNASTATTSHSGAAPPLISMACRTAATTMATATDTAAHQHHTTLLVLVRWSDRSQNQQMDDQTLSCTPARATMKKLRKCVAH